MKHILFVIVFLGAALFFGPSMAEDGREFYARQYVNLMHYDELFDESQRKCRSAMKNMSPESIFEGNPNYFYGITPKSHYWPDVIEIYRKYYEEGCNYMSSSDFEDIYVREYSKVLTISDLKKAIDFYKSDLGLKLRDAAISANSAFQDRANKMFVESLEKANESFTKRIADLGKRYKSNPM